MSLINWIFDAYQHHKIDQTRSETSRLREEVAAIELVASGGVSIERYERLEQEIATNRRRLVELEALSAELQELSTSLLGIRLNTRRICRMRVMPPIRSTQIQFGMCAARNIRIERLLQGPAISW